MKLAARIDQPIPHQQLHHLRPGYAFSPSRQFLGPEPIQLQLPPQFASQPAVPIRPRSLQDRKSTRLNSSHVKISYAVFCLKKKKKKTPDSQERDEETNYHRPSS